MYGIHTNCFAQEGRSGPAVFPAPLRAEMLAWWALAAAARGDVGVARERLDGARSLAPGHEAVTEAARILDGARGQ